MIILQRRQQEDVRSKHQREKGQGIAVRRGIANIGIIQSNCIITWEIISLATGGSHLHSSRIDTTGNL